MTFEVMLVFEGQAAPRVIQNWVACTATQGLGIVWNQTATEGHV